MPKPTIELPNVPDGWLDMLTLTPSVAPENEPSADPSAGGGLLGGWQPKDWSPVDSGLNLVMSPDDIKTIDLAGETAPREPWLGGVGHGPATQLDAGAPEWAMKAFIPD